MCLVECKDRQDYNQEILNEKYTAKEGLGGSLGETSVGEFVNQVKDCEDQNQRLK